jgi:hypothetical protein
LFKIVKAFAVHQIEPRLYGALWFSALALSGWLICVGILDAPAYAERMKFVAGILTVNIAMIGWIWSGRMTILMARKTNAVNALNHLRSSEVTRLKDVVYPYIELYDQFKRSNDCENRPQMPETEIQMLLGIYEALAVLVIYGAADTDVIWASQALVFKRIYCGLYHHIERVQEKDERYFIHLESLTCKWHPELRRGPAIVTHPGGLFSPMRNADT